MASASTTSVAANASGSAAATPAPAASTGAAATAPAAGTPATTSTLKSKLRAGAGAFQPGKSFSAKAPEFVPKSQPAASVPAAQPAPAPQQMAPQMVAVPTGFVQQTGVMPGVGMQYIPGPAPYGMPGMGMPGMPQMYPGMVPMVTGPTGMAMPMQMMQPMPYFIPGAPPAHLQHPHMQPAMNGGFLYAPQPPPQLVPVNVNVNGGAAPVAANNGGAATPATPASPAIPTAVNGGGVQNGVPSPAPAKPMLRSNVKEFVPKSAGFASPPSQPAKPAVAQAAIPAQPLDATPAPATFAAVAAAAAAAPAPAQPAAEAAAAPAAAPAGKGKKGKGQQTKAADDTVAAPGGPPLKLALEDPAAHTHNPKPVPAASPAPEEAAPAVTPASPGLKGKSAADETDEGRRKALEDGDSQAESALDKKVEEKAIESRKYDLDFLLSLREKYTEKPKNFPLASLIADIAAGGGSPAAGALRPGGRGTRGGKDGAGLRPGAGRGFGAAASRITSTPKNNAAASARGGRGGGRGGVGAKPHDPRRRNQDVPMDIGEIKPLDVTANRYQIKKSAEPDEALKRSVTSILNKLTPEKFDTLVERIVELKIETADHLRDVVVAIFDKAVAEPAFSPTYAEFCLRLTPRMPTFEVIGEGDKKEQQTFKRHILNQCQTEFEGEGMAELSDEQKAALSDEKRLELATKQKKRQLGTIRFIGELFGRNMLASRILTNCLVILLGDINKPIEENLEAMAKLLATVGKQLDAKDSASHEFLNQYFELLEQLGRSALLPSRIKFMILDTLDLRKNKWVARRKEVEAKKIADIHQEQKEEEERKERERLAAEKRKGGKGGGGRGGGRGGGSAASTPHGASFPAGGLAPKKDRYAAAKPVSPKKAGKGTPAATPTGSATPKEDDGWATVGSAPATPARGRGRGGRGRGGAGRGGGVEPAPAKDDRDESSAASQDIRAQGGSGSGGARKYVPPSQKAKEEAAAAREQSSNNAFSALNEDEDAADDTDDDTPKKSPATKPAAATAVADDDDGDDAKDGDAKSGGALSAEEAKAKIRSLWNEYFSSADAKEAAMCVADLGTTEHNAIVVVEGFTRGIEAKDRERALVVGLLQQLYDAKTLTRDHVTAGLQQTMALLEDLLIDSPKAVEWVGQMLGPLLAHGLVGFAYLDSDDVEPIRGSLPKLVAYALATIKKDEKAGGLAGARKVVADSGLKLASVGGKKETFAKLMTDLDLASLLDLWE